MKTLASWACVSRLSSEPVLPRMGRRDRTTARVTRVKWGRRRGHEEGEEDEEDEEEEGEFDEAQKDDERP